MFTFQTHSFLNREWRSLGWMLGSLYDPDRRMLTIGLIWLYIEVSW